ncbi:hypothetical protein TNCV_1361491 [Trichonephila clavipes]|nr:hypothetical protein TNCV_1361491 [Trichonephila clavipes]
MTGQRYIDEVLLPHVRLFRGALDDKFYSYVRQRNMSSNTRCSGLSRQRGYSTSRMASAFSDLNPIENVWGALGRQVAGQVTWKLSSDKQEHPHPCTHRGMG